MKADDPQLLKAKELLVGTAEKQRKQQTNNVAVAAVVFHGICDSFYGRNENERCVPI